MTALDASHVQTDQPETTPADGSHTHPPPALENQPIEVLETNAPQYAPPEGGPPPQHQPEPAAQRRPDAAVLTSMAAVWPLKRINWPPHTPSEVLIVMQARNGPCSLIALCNVLILRNQITIQPPDRRSVSYEYLGKWRLGTLTTTRSDCLPTASLIADYLVSQISEGEEGDAFEGLSAALAKLPDLQEGMDINSVWSSHSSFKQLGEGGELKLFQLCGVELVHGWLADPSSPEYSALLKVEDYDGAVNLIVAADDLTKGRLVETVHDTLPDAPQAGSETVQLTEQQHDLVRDAVIIRHFLESNSSQLTYNGLFHLSTALSPGLYAFFRNSHLSVLYKAESADQPLYTLVTDSVFAREQTVVWETLEDVDGSASTFVDANLIRSSTAGGDYSGQTAEAALRDAERAMQGLEIGGDLALAQHLQAEEEHAAREYERRRAARAEQQRLQQEQQAHFPGRDSRTPAAAVLDPATAAQYRGDRRRPQLTPQPAKKDRDCCIM